MPDVSLWKMDIVGFAPKDKVHKGKEVPLDAEECVEAKAVTFNGSLRSWFEHVDVTKLVQADYVALELVSKIATRLAREAFIAGVKHQKRVAAEALGFTLAEDGNDET